jgi:hypothetical protein
MIFLYIVFIIFIVSFFLYNHFLKKTEVFFTQNKKGCLKTPEDYKVIYERVYFNSTDGIELSGWFIPSKNETDTTIIMTHEDGETKSETFDWSYELYEKYNLLYFDFRGCGESKGNFFSYGVNEVKDIEGVIKFLRDFREDFSKKIVIFASKTIGFCVLKMIKDDNIKVILYEPIDDIYGYIGKKLEKTGFFIFKNYFIKKKLGIDFLKNESFKFSLENVFVFLTSRNTFYNFKTFKVKDKSEIKKWLIENNI